MNVNRSVSAWIAAIAIGLVPVAARAQLITAQDFVALPLCTQGIFQIADTSTFNAVQVDTTQQAPFINGNLSWSTIKANSCRVSLTGTDPTSTDNELGQAVDIVSNGDNGSPKSGAKTEALLQNTCNDGNSKTHTCATDGTYDALAIVNGSPPKYSGPNGYDLVSSDDSGAVRNTQDPSSTDPTVTVPLGVTTVWDAKYSNSNTWFVNLKGAGGFVQMSDSWVNAVLGNIDPNGKATSAVNAALTGPATSGPAKTNILIKALAVVPILPVDQSTGNVVDANGKNVPGPDGGPVSIGLIVFRADAPATP